jgi:hypothetical protein
MSPDLVEMIERYQRAVDALATGDPEPQKKLFSRRDDVTLANPLGPPARGWNQVEDTLERASSLIRDGEPVAYERISEDATGDITSSRSSGPD